MSDIFHYQRLVEFSDTDAAGIAHYTSLIRYMESAEHALLRSLGTSVMDQARRPVTHERDDLQIGADFHLSWPRVNINVDFKAAAYFEDLLDVSVCVVHLGRSSLKYRFEISRAKSDQNPIELIGVGVFTTVCCRVVPSQPLQSIEIPNHLRAALERFCC